MGLATNTAIVGMNAEINNAQFGIGFTLKRFDLIKLQPPDNKHMQHPSNVASSQLR